MAEQYTAEQAHAAVARGAAWLDKKCPGWELEINLKALDVGKGDCCILGQTAHCVTKGKVASRNANSFEAALSWVTRAVRPTAWAEERGLYARVLRDDYPSDGRRHAEECARYEMLTVAWKELIRERLAVTA